MNTSRADFLKSISPFFPLDTFESLRQEIKTNDFEPFLAKILELSAYPLPNTESVLTELHDPASRLDKNAVLHFLLTARGRRPHPGWDGFIILIFQPLLLAIYKQCNKWDESGEYENLFHNLLACFLNTIQSLDPSVRDHAIASYVKMNTFSRLHDLYEKQWARSLKEENLSDDAETLAAEGDFTEEIEIRSFDANGLLQKLQNKGIISHSELLLLVSTIIYGNSIGKYAAANGLSRDAAKKRHRRALDRIRDYCQVENIF